MSKSIRLSRSHGVNPTIPVCAFCGREKNEVALLGLIPNTNDMEAPMHCILDYEPCEECQEQWSKGVAIISVSKFPNVDNQPPIVEGAYPTGVVAVINPDALNGEHKAGERLLMPADDFCDAFNHYEGEVDDYHVPEPNQVSGYSKYKSHSK